MTSKEFVLWLKGFTDGVHEYNITPKQWDLLKEKLEKVKDDKFVETPGMFQVHPEKPYPGVPIGEGGWGTPNTGPVWQHPHYVDPYNPYKITCTPGTTITTTPGSGSITISNPYIASFGTTGSFGTGTTGFLVTTTPGYGSVTYNPSTTTQMYPSGSAWSYTTSDEKIF